jgi:hypothetical protein
VDRSLRRVGQLLVVMGALLGAITGVTLALLVENAETSGAVTAPERAAVLAAHPPSSQRPASRAASSKSPADTNGSQRAESPDRRHRKADNNGEGRRDKPGHGKDKPGKDKSGKGK